jgi:hypothetical protein
MVGELQKFLQGDKTVLKTPNFKGPPLRQNPYAFDLDKKPL